MTRGASAPAPQIGGAATDKAVVAAVLREQSERTDADQNGGPSALVRVLVYGFVCAVLLCGLYGVESWPLSGFRLFSVTRTATQVDWEIAAVDRAGREAPVDLAAMGRGFRQSMHLLPALAAATPEERTGACTAWLGGLPSAERLRVYRRVFTKSSPGAPRQLDQRVLRFECPPR